MTFLKTPLSSLLFLLLTPLSQTALAEETAVNPDDNAPIIAYFAEDGTPSTDINEDSYYYRRLHETLNGCYYVQDYYVKNDQKQIDAVCIRDEIDLASWSPKSLQGTMRFYNDKGQITTQYFVNNSESSGTISSWSDAGLLEYEAQYEDGEPHGEVTFYNDAGEVSSELFFINGNRYLGAFNSHGMRVQSGDDFQYYRVLTGSDADSFTIQDFYKGGSKQIDPIRITDINDIYAWQLTSPDGALRFYNQEGVQIGEENYDNGVLNGAMKAWYPSGHYELVGYFKDGEQSGTWKTWYESGQIAFQEQYEEGVYHGTIKHWDENGQLRTRLIYDEGELVEETHWDEQGLLLPVYIGDFDPSDDTCSTNREWIKLDSDNSNASDSALENDDSADKSTHTLEEVQSMDSDDFDEFLQQYEEQNEPRNGAFWKLWPF